MTYFTGSVAAAWPLFKPYGASRMVETRGVDVRKGKVTDFQGAAKAEAGEVPVFDAGAAS